MPPAVVQPKTVFVALPLRSAHARRLQASIVRACGQRNFTATFPSSVGPSTPVMEEITQAIRTSQVVIADITDANPNVMYELGYAHSCRAYDPVILICREPGNLPFDVRPLRCLLFDLSAPGGRTRFESSLSKRLHEINQLSQPLAVSSFKTRTRLLNAELEELLRSGDLQTETVRYSGSTSAFAFGERETASTTLQGLLREEQHLLTQLAKKGCRVKCIVTPPGPQAFIPDGRQRAIRRIGTLLQFLNSADREVLRHIAWAVSPYFQRNLYIVGHNCCFEGYKTNAAIGFDLTHRYTTTAAIASHIDFYESLFTRLANTMLDRNRDEPFVWSHQTISRLRKIAVGNLERSLEFLRRVST